MAKEPDSDVPSCWYDIETGGDGTQEEKRGGTEGRPMAMPMKVGSHLSLRHGKPSSKQGIDGAASRGPESFGN